MYIQKFEDIIAWQKAKELTLLVYKSMKTNHDFGFRDQILCASVSIMNNIAEGFERQGSKEFRQFLFISKGSCAEVRSMLILAKELGYLTEQEFLIQNTLADDIAKLLRGFIRSIS